MVIYQCNHSTLPMIAVVVYFVVPLHTTNPLTDENKTSLFKFYPVDPWITNVFVMH